MRTGMVLGMIAGLCAAAGAAQAQGVAGTVDGPPLVLLCSGSDQAVSIAAPRYGSAYGVVTGYGVQRTPAQLGVMVEKGEVRVRPPPTSEPLFGKKSADGWYPLEKAEVTAFVIRGRSTQGGRLLSERLDLDRRTGAATFADFVGTCRVVATSAQGVAF